MIWRFGSGRRMPTRVCLELGTVCPLHPSEAATPVYGALNAMPVPATAHRGDRTGPLAPTANCHSVFGGPQSHHLKATLYGEPWAEDISLSVWKVGTPECEWEQNVRCILDNTPGEMYQKTFKGGSVQRIKFVQNAFDIFTKQGSRQLDLSLKWVLRSVRELTCVLHFFEQECIMSIESSRQPYRNTVSITDNLQGVILYILP